MRLRRLMKSSSKYLTILLLSVVSCIWAEQASAQSYLSPGYIIGEIRDGLGIIQPQPAPDFVVRGRPDPATLEYRTLKPPPRDFHSKANSPSERLAAEAPAIAELEAARSKTQARAAAGQAAAGIKSKAGIAPVEEDPPPMKWSAWDTE
jgi:hypothetical protein